MAMQRNPEVGDIVKSKLYREGDVLNAYQYLKVTNIVEYKDGDVVQLKPLIDGPPLHLIQEEYMLFFENYYVILEDATEKSIKVLYGTKS